jgi:hypothetical protein
MMRSTPDFDMDTFLEPLSFNFDASGSFFGQVGEISASVDKVPIRVVIPFLKRKRRMLTVACIGGFNIKIHPMQIQIEKANVQTQGILGTKGLKGKLNGKIGCKSDINATGDISGKAANVKIEFEPEMEHDRPEEFTHDEHRSKGE